MKNFINKIQQIRRGSSWNLNQEVLLLMATDIITKQYKNIPRENKRMKKSCLEAMMFDPCLEPLVF